MVGLNIVIAVVLGFTAALCAGASLGMRGNRSMAWLAVGLASGSIQTVIMAISQGAAIQIAATAILAPLAYMSANQAIRAMAPRYERGLMVATVVGGLVTVALILLMLNSPFFWIALTVQLACTIAIGNAAVRMMLQARRGILDGVTIVGLCAISTLCAARMPLLVLHFGFDVTFDLYRHSVIETAILSICGLLVPPVIFLLLGRTVGDTITKFRQQSERDGLTGLLNRRAFDALVANPTGSGGAVIFADIDHFKQVNDRFGHQAGDQVICAFADIIARTGYPAGRIGGEEFAILLINRSVADANDLAEMIRARFYSTHTVPDSSTTISASFGIAGFEPATSAAAAVPKADFALYAAKTAGRNRVVCADMASMPTVGHRWASQAA